MRIRRVMVIAVAVTVALVTTACTSTGAMDATTQGAEAAASTTTSSPAPSDQVSAIWAQPMGDAQVVHASDGRNHIEYNLLVVNAYSDPVTLSAVTIIGPDGDELGRVDGATLEAATQTLYSHTPSATIPASGSVAVEVDVSLPTIDAVPANVSNRIEYTLPSGVAGNVIIDGTVVHGPNVDVDRTKAITIAPPLAGDGWLATSACCSANVHRDLRLSAGGLSWATSETFAVDWAKARGDRLYDGTGDENDQFYGFGANVLAVADATVVSTTDGVPDSPPFKSTTPDSKEGFGGNQIILKLSDGVYAAYAHLQPGSITVKKGDRVKTGDVIAKLGNSGPSQGPHLHFGLLDKPDLFVGKSLPFVFGTLDLVGEVDFANATGDTLPIAPKSAKLRKAYPLYGTIVDFP
jgi:hypothetical protein